MSANKEKKQTLGEEITSKDLPSINVGDLIKKGGGALSGMLSSLSSRLNLALKEEPIDNAFIAELEAKIREIEAAMRASEKEESSKGGKKPDEEQTQNLTPTSLQSNTGGFGSVVDQVEGKNTTGLEGGDSHSSFNIGAPTYTEKQLVQKQQEASTRGSSNEEETWTKKIRDQQEEAARVADERKANNR